MTQGIYVKIIPSAMSQLLAQRLHLVELEAPTKRSTEAKDDAIAEALAQRGGDHL